MTRQLVHDLPVEVIGRKHWGDYIEPDFHDFHVTLQLPSIKSVRNIVDHLKSMSFELIVSATRDGRLTFKIETALIKLCAHFPNLNIQSVAGKERFDESVTEVKHCFAEGLVNNTESDSDGEENMELNNADVSCRIDIRKFLTLLNGLQITNHRMICSIVHEKMVKLHFEQPEVATFQCFLTHLSS